jgi:hypothetical protein
MRGGDAVTAADPPAKKHAVFRRSVQTFARAQRGSRCRTSRLLLTLVLGPFLILLAFGLQAGDEAIPHLFAVPDVASYPIEQNARPTITLQRH